MNRKEHLEWAKKRAIEYVDKGDLNQAFASLISDLAKHPQTWNPAVVELGRNLLIAGHLDTPDKMRRFIDGFN